VRAYRKFAGLYNFTLLTASTDDAQASLQSRLDLAGVSYENGMRATRAFLSALGRSGAKPAAMSGPWFIETLARNGDVLHRHRVDALPIRLGRGYDNDFILDDDYAPPATRVVEPDEDGAWCCATSARKNGVITGQAPAASGADGRHRGAHRPHLAARARGRASRCRRNCETAPCTAGKARCRNTDAARAHAVKDGTPDTDDDDDGSD
jgi:hypothetical protein